MAYFGLVVIFMIVPPGIWPDDCPALCTEHSPVIQKASLYCSPAWRTHPAPTHTTQTRQERNGDA